MSQRIALVPHTTTTVVFNLNKSYMNYDNGVGFEVVVPAVAAASVLEEIANSIEISTEEPSDGDTSGGTNEGDNSEGTDTPVTSKLGSSGSGCDTLAGSFVLLDLAAVKMAFSARKK